MRNKVCTIFIITVLICMITISFNSVNGTTKEDIFEFVNNQSVCGDTALFNSYKSTFTRLIKQKNLSSSDLSLIYSYLSNAVEVLNSKGVCKVSDLSKLTKKEKEYVYNNLYAGAGIITNAPKLSFEEKEQDNNKIQDEKTDENINVNVKEDNTNNSNENNVKEKGTNIIVNSQTNTMDIYEDGVLVDKVNLSENKMTYTGVNVTYVIIVCTSLFIFITCLIIYIKMFNIHKAKVRFLKNILMSIMICTTTLILAMLLLGAKLDTFKSMINLISIKFKNEEYGVKLNEDKSIKVYPSYGYNYGVLSIDSLDINQKIYFGDSADILNVGIGHTTWSDMPTEGGVIIYSGHNNTSFLNNLKDIKLNDKIIVDTTYAKCTYTVLKTEILEDKDTEKLKKIEDKETLILYTCYPFDSFIYSNKRFVTYSVIESIKWK